MASAQEPTVNLTPLIDVVLIILVFFIATASLTPFWGVEIERGLMSEADIQDNNSMRIALNSSGTIHFADRELSFDELTALLHKKIKHNPQLAVVIDADKRADVASLLAVIDAARNAGARHVSLGVNHTINE